MTELETMQRAKMYLDKLSQGVDPITNQPVPQDSALNNARLARCFTYVSGVLDQVIANGGTVGSKERYREFSIAPAQLAMVRLSREPVRVTQLAEMIAQATGDPKMKRPKTTAITNWLESQGFLEKQTGPDGKPRRVPTREGIRMGLSSEMRQSQSGDYLAVFYNIDAQRFVLDHLFEMLSAK